ncbi:MAG: IreB family regulatory phosphoprotein [Clostridia bacterium]
MDDKNTMLFVVPNEKQSEMSQVMSEVYKALKEKGYNPLSQLVGYVMSGDPTYITNYKNARSLITRLERDEIIEELFSFYISEHLEKDGPEAPSE